MLHFLLKSHLSLGTHLNMRRYTLLLTLGRSKRLPISNKRCIHNTTANRLHHPLPPPPPSPRKSWGVMSRISHYHPQKTLLNPLLHRYYNSQLASLQASEKANESPHNYQVTVKARDIVSAAHAPKHDLWLPLSNLDLLLPPLQAGVLFCYKKNTIMSPENMVRTIKKSLAEVLSTFYPLAGEIVQNSQGEPEVRCNNRGVEFTHAHADVQLKDLDIYHPDDSIKGKLVPVTERGLLSVQVTELNCGGIVISCAIDHRIADGYSFNMFLVAWAEVAQSKPISNFPSFRPSILNPRRPPLYDAALDNFYIPISSLPPPPSSSDDHHLCSRTYFIPAESINHIQRQASSQEHKRSKLQSFTAYLWKLIAESNDNVNDTCKMGVVVSGRQFFNEKHLQNPSSLQTHFGNVLSIPYGEASVSELLETPLEGVAKMVLGFMSKATNEGHFRKLIDWVETHRPETAIVRVYVKMKDSDRDAVVVSSAQGLPLEEMDFGWGEPVFGSYHFPWGGTTGYVATMPSVKKNGDWVVYMHLYPKHLDFIETMAPHVFKPLTRSYLCF